MGLTNSGNQSAEQSEHLLDAQFTRISKELVRELSRVETGKASTKMQIAALEQSLLRIVSTVKFVHKIFARCHYIRILLAAKIPESQLLKTATRGFPLTLRKAEAELKEVLDLIPESPNLVHALKWSDFRWAKVVMEMGLEHHRILEKHSKKKIRHWLPFIDEAAGRGDGTCANWSYDIQGEYVGRLRQSLACLPGCEWISIDKVTVPDSPKSGDQWITFAFAEQVTAVNRGTIQRAANRGEVVDNGLRNRGRRIDAASFMRWHEEYRKRTTGSET